MDVVFAIDSSENIADKDYIRQAEFFTKIAEAFSIHPEKTRVGSLLYSDQIQEMFEVVDYDSRSYTRPGASQVGIVLTGSPARYLELSKALVHKADRAGVQYIAVGVGPEVNDEEMRIITGSNDEHIFRLSSFEDLENIVAEVAIQACSVPVPPQTIQQDQPCGSKQEADIMFLMDSVNAGKRNSRKALDFIKVLIQELDIESDNIHVGLMSAECEDNEPGFELGAHSSKAEIEKTFDTMKGTDFHKILHNMRRGSFSRSGSRKHAKKIAILIIDGSLEEPLKTLTEAQRARIHGIEVFVIQVGEEAPQEELLMMCDDPSSQHFFQVASYADLQQVKDGILKSLCDEL
ncbi:CO6A5-like protein [Mya arenaria]|uniref:CO6A5-like protein n=2 Tax=Mya arenaria TaxID=6604 RepID=A0ABY7DXW6_MYAAR|nr:CO6A5-like protein [Mya arenaria]